MYSGVPGYLSIPKVPGYPSRAHTLGVPGYLSKLYQRCPQLGYILPPIWVLPKVPGYPSRVHILGVPGCLSGYTKTSMVVTNSLWIYSVLQQYIDTPKLPTEYLFEATSSKCLPNCGTPGTQVRCILWEYPGTYPIIPKQEGVVPGYPSRVYRPCCAWRQASITTYVNVEKLSSDQKKRIGCRRHPYVRFCRCHDCAIFAANWYFILCRWSLRHTWTLPPLPLSCDYKLSYTSDRWDDRMTI